LEEADGLNQLDTRASNGDAGDFFPGSSSNTGFSSQSTPASIDNAGATTNVKVLDIPISSAAMTVTFKVNLIATEPPDSPSSLTVTTISDTRIDLSWTDNADNENEFKIERGPNGLSFTEIATVTTDLTTYNDTGLDASTTWHYRVKAANSLGDSGYSNIASTTTGPAAPIHLAAVARTSTEVILFWKDISSDEEGFKIERSPDGITFSEIASIDPGSSTYTDENLTEATSYFYRILAFNDNGNSAYTPVSSPTTPDEGSGDSSCFLTFLR